MDKILILSIENYKERGFLGRFFGERNTQNGQRGEVGAQVQWIGGYRIHPANIVFITSEIHW